MTSLQSFSKELISIAKDIKLIALDVNGVLTNASGEQGAVREVCDLVQYSIENNYYD